MSAKFEGPLHFAPTYKYDTFSDDYDTSDKCSYGRSELKTSDHRPVFAIFQLNTLKFELQKAEPLLKDAIISLGPPNSTIVCAVSGYPTSFPQRLCNAIFSKIYELGITILVSKLEGRFLHVQLGSGMDALMALSFAGCWPDSLVADLEQCLSLVRAEVAQTSTEEDSLGWAALNLNVAEDSDEEGDELLGNGQTNVLDDFSLIDFSDHAVYVMQQRIQQNHHANVTPLIPSSGTYVNAAFELNLKEIPPQTDEKITRRKELEEIDRQPIPPYPDASSHPIRIGGNGWREYRTLGGRTYYFHPIQGICQWKPPRSTTSYKFGSDRLNVSEAQNDCVASTSADMASTAFFTEILLQREMTNDKESTLAESEIIANDPRRTADKSIMSHSLDSGINHNNHCGNSSTVPLTREHQQQSMARQLPPDTDGAHYDTPANIAAAQQHRERAIRHGLLEKCKLADNGVRLKRRDWANSYAYLFVGHLLFYKDQKSAERTGKHYPPPTDVCDLRNASVCYTDNEKQKDKRRKHVISLILLTKTEYLFCCTGEEIGAWFQAMRQAITSTPIHNFPASTIISDYCGSLSRASLRNKRDSGPFASKTNFHNSIKFRLKSASTSKALSEDRMSVVEGNTVESTPPTKESIIEKLLRFFRSRPSMESLRERGIYKPEPVFGSTLTEICAREKTFVPKFVSEVTRLIEEKGLECDGLYRVNGNLSAVQKIRCQIDQDSYEAMQHEEDIHVLTGALKLFLRELSEPTFPVPMHKDFMSAMRETGIKRLRLIDDLLIRLPPINRETLSVLIQHLNIVATNSGKNRMQIHNLAIIFGPSLFCSDERPNHQRKFSQDKGKGGGRRKSSDKRQQQEEQVQSEPTQNLAYRMIVYGQIVEFILNETDRLAIFRPSL
uniref:Uncharacterized protein n=1 Tax=Globodera rostochiensis TaxID=31243 RepID=A0A914HCK2_GLORO